MYHKNGECQDKTYDGLNTNGFPKYTPTKVCEHNGSYGETNQPGRPHLTTIGQYHILHRIHKQHRGGDSHKNDQPIVILEPLILHLTL